MASKRMSPRRRAANRKAGVVMREFYHDGLHMGVTGRLVPADRLDIAHAIAASERRRVLKGKKRKKSHA